MGIPDCIVGIKRLHDIDRSGWWVLILYIPIYGIIWFIVEVWLEPGTDGPNRFGEEPV